MATYTTAEISNSSHSKRCCGGTGQANQATRTAASKPAHTGVHSVVEREPDSVAGLAGIDAATLSCILQETPARGFRFRSTILEIYRSIARLQPKLLAAGERRSKTI